MTLLASAPIAPVQGAVPVLKRIAYRGNGPGYDGILDYVIFPDNRCVFSGIVRDHVTSTINAAENIIQAICECEEFDPKELEFFDLETCRGYGFKLEQYEFSNLVLKFDNNDRLHDVGWNWLECPAEILAIFREHIGEIVVPVLSYDQAFEQGFGVEHYAGPCFASTEEALACVKRHFRPKPEELHCWAILDFFTAPCSNVALLDGASRYQVIQKPQTVEIRESRWNIKSVADTRQSIIEYKTHGLSQKELKELAHLLWSELSSNQNKKEVPFADPLEYLMRPVMAILDGKNDAHYIYTKFRGAVRGLFGALCDDMPGFTEVVLKNSDDDALSRVFSERARGGR